MEEAFKVITGHIALAFQPLSRNAGAFPRRALWLRFAGWILLSLEFALGAELIRTAISPTWDDIGKLAVIAAACTALNYFLAHDLQDAVEMSRPATRPQPQPAVGH